VAEGGGDRPSSAPHAPMVEAVIRALIYVLCLVACVVLILWVLSSVGIVLPAMIIKIIYIILALFCLLILFRLLRPHMGNYVP
jgi:uncharacterized membrane protein